MGKHEAELRLDWGEPEIGVYGWLDQAEVQDWTSARKSLIETRTGLRAMWVRTTLRIERWTKEKTEDNASIWDESSTGKEGRGRNLGVGFSLGAWHQGGFRTGKSWRRRRGQGLGWGGARVWGRAHAEPWTND